MSISEMIVKLESFGIIVQRVPNDDRMLHADGYHGPNGKGLPDWIWDCPQWAVSSCGFGRVFLTRVG